MPVDRVCLQFAHLALRRIKKSCSKLQVEKSLKYVIKHHRDSLQSGEGA